MAEVAVHGQKHTCNDTLRLDVFVEVRLHKAKPLLYASFDVSTTLPDVSQHLLAVLVSQILSSRMTYKYSRRRDRHRSASASAKILTSSISNTRGS